MRLLIAPAAFKGTLRASAVAAAIGQGVEAAGLEPPDLCPVADGGAGTIEVLLPRLGGETAAARVTDPQGRPIDVGFALLGDGSTALVEAAAVGGREVATGAGSSRGIGELILAAAATGAEVVLVAAAGVLAPDGGAGAIAAIEAAGGIGRARLIVLADARASSEMVADRRAAEAARDPVKASALRGRTVCLAAGLCAAFGAERRSGAQLVLDALDFDARLRAAWAVVVGEGRLDRSTLDGKIVAEVATRARQAGVPAHAIVGASDLDRFDARILDLQEILTGSDPAEIRAAGTALAERLRLPTH